MANPAGSGGAVVRGRLRRALPVGLSLLGLLLLGGATASLLVRCDTTVQGVVRCDGFTFRTAGQAGETAVDSPPRDIGLLTTHRVRLKGVKVIASWTSRRGEHCVRTLSSGQGLEIEVSRPEVMTVALRAAPGARLVVAVGAVAGPSVSIGEAAAGQGLTMHIDAAGDCRVRALDGALIRDGTPLGLGQEYRLRAADLTLKTQAPPSSAAMVVLPVAALHGDGQMCRQGLRLDELRFEQTRVLRDAALVDGADSTVLDGTIDYLRSGLPDEQRIGRGELLRVEPRRDLVLWEAGVVRGSSPAELPTLNVRFGTVAARLTASLPGVDEAVDLRLSHMRRALGITCSAEQVWLSNLVAALVGAGLGLAAGLAMKPAGG